MEFRRCLGVIESPVLLESLVGSSLDLSCNIRLFVIELDYGYRYLLEVYSELSSICFLSWLCYHSMLALYDRPVLEMVSLLFLDLYQLRLRIYSWFMKYLPPQLASAGVIAVSQW